MLLLCPGKAKEFCSFKLSWIPWKVTVVIKYDDNNNDDDDNNLSLSVQFLLLLYIISGICAQ